ncbi:hypothetical protein BDR04DRAFT_1165007 [Suillus decipiens]|nr:hypothetical protein BDR04DRAFT_1165007 [Suillus decipiens]
MRQTSANYIFFVNAIAFHGAVYTPVEMQYDSCTYLLAGFPTFTENAARTPRTAALSRLLHTTLPLQLELSAGI